jgi:hypothetical protein
MVEAVEGAGTGPYLEGGIYSSSQIKVIQYKFISKKE